METPSPEKLDALIEASLHEEAMLDVPPTLHRRIEARVHYAALHDRQDKHFRISLFSLLLACVAVLVTAGGIVAVVNLDRYLRHGVAGGRGLLDSLAMQYRYAWSPDSDSFLLYGGMTLGAMALLLALVPMRKRTRRH